MTDLTVQGCGFHFWNSPAFSIIPSLSLSFFHSLLCCKWFECLGVVANVHVAMVEGRGRVVRGWGRTTFAWVTKFPATEYFFKVPIRYRVRLT